MSTPLLTRHALAWLLLAQLAVMAPLLPLLPLWTSLAWLLVAFWHWRIYRGDWHFPPRPLKLLLAAATIGGIWLEYKTALGLEPQLALLVTAFILKLLELKALRDQWIVICLGYFIIACAFLFNQTMGAMLIAAGQLAVLLLAQQAMFRQRTQLGAMLRSNWQLLYQSLPLMLLLFVVFPRIGPLWSVPLPGESARTGMSDSMSPGDISRLSRSGELAFRARFDGPIPPSPQLYWRGIVLEQFDGRRWSRPELPAGDLDTADGRGQSLGEGLSYELTLEPGVHEWLLGIAVARPERDDLRLDGLYQLIPRRVLTGRLNYRLTSYLDEPLDQPLAAFERYRNLWLPEQINPRSRALAEAWREQYSEPRQRLRAAQQYLLDNPFVYTLEPPKLGRHSVDEFLFDTRRGFCEHFAGSFVVLMRAAGVPARVVMGYQGGERSGDGSYLLVHQSDAHAWAEVWLDGEGWRRVDPTALVAPDRIELGAAEALAGESGFLADAPLSLRRFKGFVVLARLRLWMDKMEYAWAKWVLNYDTERQWLLLSDWFGELTGRGFVIAVSIAFAVPLAIAALLTLRLPPQQRRSPAVAQYLRCCEWLARKGVTRAKGEAPKDYAARVAREQPEWGEWINDVTRVFYHSQYQPARSVAARQALTELRRLRRRPYRSRKVVKTDGAGVSRRPA